MNGKEKEENHRPIWMQTKSLPEREPLSGSIRTEVVVIGAGMAGLLTAYLLHRRGRKVVVLEADRIGSGQSGNTTAKITSQHGLFYTSFLKNHGREAAELYARAQESAIRQYREMIREEEIACHFKEERAWLYAKERQDVLKREADVAAQLGISAYFTSECPLPFPIWGAVCFEQQAQFHPLEFMDAIAEKLVVYEKTKALRVREHWVDTDRGSVQAEQIIFATHYPFPIAPGFYFARQHQERSYVIALKDIPVWDGMFYGIEEDGLSFRWFEETLLVGGGGHRTGDMRKAAKGKKQRDYGYQKLEQQIHVLFPNAKEVARWSAQDCMTHDEIPFIGHYSIYHPDWYVVTGLKKWGMTGSMVAAQVLCDLVCGETNPYQTLFAPWRFPLGKSGLTGKAGKKLGEDLKYSIAGLTKGWLLSGKPPRNPRCPHMGCALQWNPEENTWDCPCHGSRFTKDGKLLDGPAQTGLRKQPDQQQK